MKTYPNRRRPRWREVARVTVLAMSGLLLSSCLQQFELTQPEPLSCSTRRLNIAASLYEEAKDFLTAHFKERDHLSLLYAYYASVTRRI